MKRYAFKEGQVVRQLGNCRLHGLVRKVSRKQVNVDIYPVGLEGMAVQYGYRKTVVHAHIHHILIRRYFRSYSSVPAVTIEGLRYVYTEAPLQYSQEWEFGQYGANSTLLRLPHLDDGNWKMYAVEYLSSGLPCKAYLSINEEGS